MDDAGNKYSATSDLSELRPPSLNIHFAPELLPSGVLQLRDASDFIAAFQLYLTRTVVSRDSSTRRLSNDPSTYQTLLVIPTGGSLDCLVIPLVHVLPWMYEGVHPTLIAVQHDLQTLGTVLIAAGKDVAHGALQGVGAILVQQAYASRKKNKSAATQNHMTGTQDGQVNQPPRIGDGEEALLEELRGISQKLDGVQRSLAGLAQGRSEELEFLGRDAPARVAVGKMVDVSRRPDLRDGNVTISVTQTTYNMYDIRPSEPMVIDKATSNTLDSLVKEMNDRAKIAVAAPPPSLPVVRREMLLGTIAGLPDYTGLRFYLNVPPYYEAIECRFSPDLVPSVQRSISPDARVIVSGLLHPSYSRGRHTEEFMDVHEIHRL